MWLKYSCYSDSDCAGAGIHHLDERARHSNIIIVCPVSVLLDNLDFTKTLSSKTREKAMKHSRKLLGSISGVIVAQRCRWRDTRQSVL